jgi:predicted transcriptional regulator
MTYPPIKQADPLAFLNAEDLARLERLSGRAESTPEEMWPAVQRYGFEDMESSVQAWLDAEGDIAAGKAIPHEEVMALAMQIASKNGQRGRKTG